jgi:site-specific DNA-methyltransferase (adenine-specific)
VQYKIYNNDCLKVLDTLEEQSFDLIVADYPFKYSDHEWDYTGDNFKEFLKQSLIKFKPLLKSKASMFLMFGFDTVAYAKVLADTIGYNLINWIIWKFDTGYHPTTRFKSRSYHILWLGFSKWNFYGDRVRIAHKTNDPRNNPKGAIPSDVWNDITEVKKNSEEYCGHTGQKPIELIQRCVLATTNPGDLILDPFMGTGTTGVVCAKWDRDFIGIDIQEEFCEVAEERIEKVLMQPRLL